MMSAKITDMKPLANRVLLEWEEALGEYKTTGRVKLIKPENAREAHFTGIVVSMGPGCYNEFKVGDRVLFDQFCSPEQFREDGKRYAVISDTDIFCVVPAREEDKVEVPA